MSAEMISSIAPLAAILRLAKERPVFPCLRHAARGKKAKAPATDNGFYDATQDEGQIVEWWSKNPEYLVGVPTGERTGLTVVDVDPAKFDDAGREWFERSTDLLLTTRSHGTLHDGFHYVFSTSPEVRFSSTQNATLAGRKRGGVDIRGEGGYVIWWPMHGGSRHGVIAPIPAGLIDEYRQSNDTPKPLNSVSPEKWREDAPRVREALKHIDPDCDRETWYRLLAAVNFASGGSQEGFDLIHEWSSGRLTGTSPKLYAGARDCAYTYTSFKHGGNRRTTLGSLFHLAQANGWKEAEEFDWSNLNETLDEAKKTPIEESKNKLIQGGFWAGDAGTHIDLPYLIKGLFDRGQMIVLWGPPGSGKTFAALSMAAHVGAGRVWAGRRVKRGKVLYVCAESTRKRLENRTRALLDAYPNLADTEMFLVPLTLDLLRGEADIVAVLAACEQIEDVALIVVDTLAVTFGGGDENSPEDMGLYVSNMKLLKDRTGAAVMIVHHCGKDEARGMRGHSSLLGALDGELAVERPDPKEPRIFKAGKLREGESFCDLFTFDLEVKELGIDPDGDAVTTCVVVPKDVGSVLRRPSTKAQLALLKALEERRRAGDVTWTEKEIKVIADPLMHRNSVRKVIFGLNNDGWLKASVGGWALSQEAKP